MYKKLLRELEGIGKDKVLQTGTCKHCREIFFPEHEAFCKGCGRIAEDSGSAPKGVDDETLDDEIPYDDDQYYPEV